MLSSIVCNMLSYCSVTLSGNNTTTQEVFHSYRAHCSEPRGYHYLCSTERVMEAPKDETSPWQDCKTNYSFINYNVSLYVRETSGGLNGICWQHTDCLKTPMKRAHLHRKPGTNMDRDKEKIR